MPKYVEKKPSKSLSIRVFVLSQRDMYIVHAASDISMGFGHPRRSVFRHSFGRL